MQRADPGLGLTTPALQQVVAYAGNVGGRAELAAFTSGIQVQVVEQVQPVKMPTASMDMLAQYFLKSGSKLSTQVLGGRTEVVGVVDTAGGLMSNSPSCAATVRARLRQRRVQTGMRSGQIRERNVLCI